MNKFLMFFLICFMFFLPVQAQEDEAPLTSEALEEIPEEEVNAFGYPDKSLVKVIELKAPETTDTGLSKPECSDPKLAEQARAALRPYLNFETSTAAEKRRVSLIFKNVDHFLPLGLTELSPSSHREALGRVTELKINNHLDAAHIQVCQSDNPLLEAKVYLILYDDGKDVRVDVLNFNPTAVPSFIFKAD